MEIKAVLKKRKIHCSCVIDDIVLAKKRDKMKITRFLGYRPSSLVKNTGMAKCYEKHQNSVDSKSNKTASKIASLVK